VFRVFPYVLRPPAEKRKEGKRTQRTFNERKGDGTISEREGKVEQDLDALAPQLYTWPRTPSRIVERLGGVERK
jgi:hypothetical protein